MKHWRCLRHACLTKRAVPLKPVSMPLTLWVPRLVHAGPHAGPFGSRSTANTSPGLLTALTQPPQDTGAQQQQQQQQHLVAYVPPQLAALLRQLAAELAGDVQAAAGGTAAAAGAGAAAGQSAVMSGAGGGAVSYDVAASALQVRLCLWL